MAGPKAKSNPVKPKATKELPSQGGIGGFASLATISIGLISIVAYIMLNPVGSCEWLT
jgi:hypothetical protein